MRGEKADSDRVYIMNVVSCLVVFMFGLRISILYFAQCLLLSSLPPIRIWGLRGGGWGHQWTDRQTDNIDSNTNRLINKQTNKQKTI